MTKELLIRYGTSTLTLSGEAELGKDGDALFLAAYDERVDKPIVGMERLHAATVLILRTTPMSIADMMSLQSMIHAPYVELTMDGRTVSAIPTCDDMALRIRDNKPGSLVIRFRYSARDGFYSPDDIITAGQRIFTEQFSTQFV